MTRTITPTPASAAPAGTARPARHWTGADPASPWPATARALRDTLAATSAAHDRDGTFTHEGFDALRPHRFASMLVPADLGGGGASLAEACAALAELARGCPSTALTLSMHSHLVAAQVWRHHRGMPAPVLAKVADAQLMLVSTGAADWIDSSGTAVKVEGGYRLTGAKAPSSGAPIGNMLATSFRWDDAPDGPQVLHLTVPFTAPGLSVRTTWDTMGMRGTGSETVVLDDVFVPDEAVMLARPAGRWHPIWATILGVALPLIMATYVGVAEEAADRAVALVAGRAGGERAPLVGRMLNRLTVARDAVAAMIALAGDLDFEPTAEHAAAVLTRKAIAAEAVLDTTRTALEAGGGTAFGVAAGIERLHRDAHGALYHPLPADRQERFCGRLALGLDPVAG